MVSAEAVDAGAGVPLSSGFRRLATRPSLGQRSASTRARLTTHFIIDRHPRAANVWIVGGGSGHGFKMGPALGEMVASLVLGERASTRSSAWRGSLGRPPRGWQQKWT